MPDRDGRSLECDRIPISCRIWSETSERVWEYCSFLVYRSLVGSGLIELTKQMGSIVLK